MGNPRKLTAEVQDAIVDALKKGNTWRAAARAGGISFGTLKLWKRLGKTGDEPYRTFLTLTMAAANQVEIAVVSCFYKAAQEDWRAAIAYAERRYWKDWGVRKPKESGPKDPEKMTPEETRDALAKELLKRADRPYLERLLEKVKDEDDDVDGTDSE